MNRTFWKEATFRAYLNTTWMTLVLDVSKIDLSCRKVETKKEEKNKERMTCRNFS